jgi:hypothetical protein
VDGIESAIRNALARGDASDRAHRERVYRSVFAALERRMSEPPGVDAEEAQRRREALKQRIVAIEKEFVPRQAPPAPPPAAAPVVAPASARDAAAAPAVDAPLVETPRRRAADGLPMGPEVDSPARLEHARSAAPAVEHSGPSGSAGRAEPSFAEVAGGSRGPAMSAGDYALPGIQGDLPGNEVEDEYQPRRRPWGILLIAATLFAIVAIGAWWMWETGFFGRDDGSVPNPPLELEEEEFTPGEPPPLSQDGPAERSWITVFSAAEPGAVSAASGGRVEALEDDGQPFLRLNSGTAGAAVSIPVAAAALEAVAGGVAVFDIVARAQEGEETQISVSCDFGVLGDCGRRRYVVGLHRADFLFEVELGAGSPGPDNVISIVTDVDGTGKAIDLFEIRLAPAE